MTNVKLRTVLTDLTLIQRIHDHTSYELLSHTNLDSFLLVQIRN